MNYEEELNNDFMKQASFENVCENPDFKAGSSKMKLSLDVGTVLDDVIELLKDGHMWSSRLSEDISGVFYGGAVSTIVGALTYAISMGVVLTGLSIYAICRLIIQLLDNL